ncbi:MAG: biopolymer transporter ExbD, partial [Flavobacteriia bacterium]|nr:biopolymer transporter ExbD [Flavobacteriia bacterium]
EACDYCQGERNPSSSDNPDKAIISLKNDRETSYKVYISVQNELVAAYNDLRNREFQRLFPSEGTSYVEAQKRYDDPRTSLEVQEELKPKLDRVKEMYPQKLSEAEPNKTN